MKIDVVEYYTKFCNARRIILLNLVLCGHLDFFELPIYLSTTNNKTYLKIQQYVTYKQP